MLTVGGILEGAFGLVKRQPIAVAVWWLLYVAAVPVMMLMMRPYTSMVANPDPQLAAAQMMSGLRWIFLAELVLLAWFMILFNAVQRAVLRPQDSAFFYIRLGMDELRIFGLSLILIILSYAALLVAMLVIMIPVGILFAAAGAGGAMIGVPIAILGMLAGFAAIVWFDVRLSLAFPLTLLRRKIILGESWRLTRGRFWTLFGAYLLVIVLVWVVTMVAMSFNFGSYWGELIQAGSNPERARAVQVEMIQNMTRITPRNLLYWFLVSIAGILMLALWGGALATAARLLTGGERPLEETFA